jgi:hypothetical protein
MASPALLSSGHRRWITMKASIVGLGALLLLTSCRAITEPFVAGEELTWDQYESIEPGMTATEIRRIYGTPREIRRDEHLIFRYTYLCWDQAGKALLTVDLRFDPFEVLLKKSVW